MKYHFRAGRGKNIYIDDSSTFEDLGFAILREYDIDPDHLFLFQFENGDSTDSASPFGPMHDGLGTVPVDSPIKKRKMKTGETLVFVYDLGSEWTRKVKLVGIE